MIPKKRSPILEIPITFDSRGAKQQGLSNTKFYLALIVFGVWLFLSIVCILVDLTILRKILYIMLGFIVGSSIVRFLIMREPYFKKKRDDLIEKNYQYPYSIFWNIYEVTNSYPTICRYANGLKSMFVVFDKDVIVGREPDAEYYHYEAISDAYLQMHKRGIDCIHIDYMDVVGKDSRVKTLFDLANQAENPDLKSVLLRLFDNVEDIMQHSYASYDVYCFFFKGKDELFLDELDVVLNSFLDANYIRYRILDKNDISELVKSILNIDNFSVRDASERLFSDLGGTHYLTPIWVERETSKGVERVTLNKTTAQKEAERATREVEKVTRKNRKRKNKELLEEDLENLEDNYDMYSGQMGVPNNQMYLPNNYGNQGYMPPQQNVNNYQQDFENVVQDMNFDDNLEDWNNNFVEESTEEVFDNANSNSNNSDDSGDPDDLGMLGFEGQDSGTQELRRKENSSDYEDEDLEIL